MRTFYSIILLLFSYLAIGQNQDEKYVDSLESVLKNVRHLEKEQRDAKTETQKVDVLCLLARHYDGIDSTKTFDYAYEALDISGNLDYETGLVNANFTLGRAYMYLDPIKALDYLKTGAQLADRLIKKDSSRKLLSLWAVGTYNLGITYGYLGNDSYEIEYVDKVIPTVEKLGDSLFLANIYTNLGTKYLDLQELNKNYRFEKLKNAYRNLLRGRKIYRLLGNPPETTFNIIQLAMAYEGMDSLANMKKSLDESRILLKKYPNDFDRFNFSLQESQYQIRTQQPEKALGTLDDIVGLVNNDSTTLQFGIVMQRYAKAYQIMNDYDNAVKFFTNYIDHSKKLNRGPSYYRGLYDRSANYAALDEHEKAYNDLLKAFHIYDSLETKRTITRLEELNLKFETAKREKEILGLKVKNEEKKSQSYLLAGIISLLALLLFVGYYVYDRRLKKSRKNEMLQSAQMNQLKHEQEAKIYSAMIEGQEKERKRLAIDLHDGLGGRLSGISLNLSKLDKDEPKQYPKKQLQKVMKDLDDSLTELRTIARNMMPETLVKFGLQAALKDYCSSMTDNDTKVTLQFYGSEKGIEIGQQVTMYRVIQELINNAVKHANASEILVQYMREGNQVDITVEDNGVGFKKELVETKSSGMGLSNLRTRVAYLKGNLDFQSEENEGTTVNVHLIVDQELNHDQDHAA